MSFEVDIWLKWRIAGGDRRIGLVIWLAHFLRLDVELLSGGGHYPLTEKGRREQ